MRRLLSILLLPLVFTSTVIAGFDVHELEKLGNVVLHYQHHVSEHGETDLSFFEYLADHFSASSSHEDQQHKGLPLSEAGHFCGSHVLPAFLTPHVRLHVPVVTLFLVPEDATAHHALDHERIFQPPRS
ncbi:MAG: hypothetical protein KA339_05975 [Candidatus Kapabacteria bacterium]|nr:hypothetical protein [Ignavibacteria bacterium]MBP6510086.1 hypothetical protein [Candidatus Kapabacteria bacterium]MBP7093991.1 hypothetical protein [Candidatus Kapabacteria bacterium]